MEEKYKKLPSGIFFWLDFDLVVLLIPYCQGFFGHSQLGEGGGGGLFGTIPCNSFI